MPSFDIVSEVNAQEFDNAINQTRKEVAGRYDFRGAVAEIKWDGKSKSPVVLTTEDDEKMRALIDILQSKMMKRGIDIEAVSFGKAVPAGGRALRAEGKLVHGLPSDKAKEIVKKIKDLGLKVQAQMQDEQVRVTGKKRDDLQDAIQALRAEKLGVPLQFTNFRD